MPIIPRINALIVLGWVFFARPLSAQVVEKIHMPNLATVQLFTYGDQQGLPVIRLSGQDRLQLEFDDLDGGVKNYYYTYVLCDYHWKPANLSSFDYIKGFTQIRINTYRTSSIALTRYTHYQAILPDKDCMPSRSGNYLLKVYLDGDTSKLAFTRQIMVTEPRSVISAQVVQPFIAERIRTHQKVKFSVNLKGLNSFSAAQQVKVVILQNNRWDIAQRDIPPTIVRGNTLEFNAEQVAVFPGGKEWRWLDLRSFRLQSDRVERADYKPSSTEIFLFKDQDRSESRYLYFTDLNGTYRIMTAENINPFNQGDYATVNFYFQPPNGRPFPGNLFLAGQFTGYQKDDRWKMRFNNETGLYEQQAYLKQGYYNYTYLLTSDKSPDPLMDLEGNYWETENSYTILVYFKGFADRCDQLIGVSTINSQSGRPGFSF
jgi:hypothetical protein